uniref:GOLD domain-containing protein n=1 Tax=Fibrocapsa japonica TaxID=94617 RepID=A0A7S2V9A1_9STRA|mmetsp:Transcript_8916/g.13716  ORF Transcript_8916/g.13716 Transcript_8916/m.13716 type:complete len:194 (+) Transcript_8916:1-582(+)
MLDLEPGEERCIGQEVGDNAATTFSMHVVPSREDEKGLSKNEAYEKPARVQATVRNPWKKRLFRRELLFSPATTVYEPKKVDAGLHTICFQNYNDSPRRRISLEVEVADTKVARIKDHLAPVERSFKRTETALKSINNEMDYMRAREARMAATSESTARRIQWFSFLSIFILLAVCAVQIFYLKRFFLSKKLL